MEAMGAGRGATAEGDASVPEGGEAVIDVFTLAGGVEFRVPADWAA